MATAEQQIANLPKGGVLYEPRSLWSFISVPLTGDPQLVRMNRDHLYNGSKYPITLERMAVDAWNYSFQQSNDPQIPWQDKGSVQATAEIAVTAPFRQHYSRQPIQMSSIPIAATGQPRGAFPLDVFHSSLFGISCLNFSRPMYLPSKSVINWDLSSAYGIAGADFFQDNAFDRHVNVTQVVQQEGGLLAGYARTRRYELRQLTTAGKQPLVAGTFFQVPYAGWPFPPDAQASPEAVAADGNQFWHPTGAFNAAEFTQQDATRGGSDCYTGLRVAIDQIDVDDADPAFGDTPNMYCSRIGNRARIANGGSGEWWWREGAPLSVTLDTITPARVTPLEIPITLSPHDCLDVEVLVPGFPDADLLPDFEAYRLYNLVISFNGWAAIEA